MPALFAQNSGFQGPARTAEPALSKKFAAKPSVLSSILLRNNLIVVNLLNPKHVL